MMTMQAGSAPRVVPPVFSWDPGLASSGIGRDTRARGVLFDLDDTLYPREQFVQSGLRAVATYVAARQGLAVDTVFAVLSRAHDRAPGREFQALCEEIALEPEAIGTCVHVFRSHEPSLQLSPAAVLMLRQMRAAGWRIGIVTNGLPSVQRAKVAALGLLRFVDAVVYAEEHADGGKPSPAPFLEAMRALRVRRSRTVVVGDDPVRDIAGARAVGLATIQLLHAGMTTDAAADADAVVDRLDAIPAVAAVLLEMVTADVA